VLKAFNAMNEELDKAMNNYNEDENNSGMLALENWLNQKEVSQLTDPSILSDIGRYIRNNTQQPEYKQLQETQLTIQEILQQDCGLLMRKATAALSKATK
jgi:hypothetical protein